jgi:hypothetical protein
MNSVLENRITFEQARNAIRKSIHRTNPVHFPYGPNYTSVDRITAVLFPSKYYGLGRQTCKTCGHADTRCYGMLESCITAGLRSRDHYPNGVQLKDWLSAYLADTSVQDATKTERKQSLAALFRE